MLFGVDVVDSCDCRHVCDDEESHHEDLDESPSIQTLLCAVNKAPLQLLARASVRRTQFGGRYHPRRVQSTKAWLHRGAAMMPRPLRKGGQRWFRAG